MRLNVDILQLQELLMDIGEDRLFQPAVASSGINSAVLGGYSVRCRTAA